MYRFSYVNSVAGQATEVDQETFHRIITDERVKQICAQIKTLSEAPCSEGESEEEKQKRVQEGVSRLKRGLPAFCWHAWFDEGKRKNYAAHASGLLMLDIDDVEQPREL